MTPRHQVSRAAIELVKRFEGYRRKAAQLADGRWTIGYGHTLSARQGAEVSEADAEALLLYDLIGVARTIGELIFADINQNQFDALCAFAYSIGPEAFRRSDVLKRVNEGAFAQAAFALELWRKAEFEGERIVVDGMVRRRAAEKLLFLTPPGGAWPTVPSAILRPQLDEAAADLAPRETPAEISASLEDAAVTRAGPGDEAFEEPPSPVAAAAAALSARLQTLFADEPAAEPEPPLEPEAPPALEPEPSPAAEAPAPVESGPAPAGPSAEEPMPRLLRKLEAVEPATERILIDDTAPPMFTPLPVEPIGEEAGEGVLLIVALALVGLAFFAGGVFWALNAPTDPGASVFTPVLVGWLAGVAGVGLVAAAVFMLLQRMARAAERRDRGRP